MKTDPGMRVMSKLKLMMLHLGFPEMELDEVWTFVSRYDK